jgi:hypothetical protein
MSLGFSDEVKRIGDLQDGIHRFEIRGQFTRTKHQTLDEYRQAMGDALFSTCAALVVYRHPLERMVSMYLSPHRWVRGVSRQKRPPGTTRGTPDERPFDIAVPEAYDVDAFREMVMHAPSLTAMMSLTPQGLSCNSLRVFRFTRLIEDLKDYLAQKGLCVDIPHTRMNAGVNPQLAIAMLADPRIVEIVNGSHHKMDRSNAWFEALSNPRSSGSNPDTLWRQGSA